MALKAGYYGIKKFIADKLNRMNPGDSFATDAEIAAVAESVTDLMEDTVGWIVANLFSDNIGLTPNKYLKDDGTTGDSGDWFVTDLMPVKGELTVNITDYATSTVSNPSVCWYDSSENYIGGAKYMEKTIVSEKLPYNAAYIRLSVHKLKISDIKVYYSDVYEEIVKKADITALGTQEGATASKLYHLGEHFYKDGKFCTVIGSADVAAASTWTLNTNYVEGTVADNLVKQATFSGSTSQYGGVEIDNTGRKVLCVYLDGTSYLGFPFIDSNKTYANVRARSDMSIVANTSVSGIYYYMD